MSAKVPLSQTYETYVEALPLEVRKKGMEVMKKIRPTLDINDRIIYADGTLGSNIFDLLRFHFGIFELKPPDYSKFEAKLEESKKKWLHLPD